MSSLRVSAIRVLFQVGNFCIHCFYFELNADSLQLTAKAFDHNSRFNLNKKT
jgi:hypothetical protein